MSATDAILPPGVWQSIAGHLQLAEWARACGTCREMFCLPLKTLNITERVPLEGAPACRKLSPSFCLPAWSAAFPLLHKSHSTCVFCAACMLRQAC
jgi:hypothetical protein